MKRVSVFCWVHPLCVRNDRETTRAPVEVACTAGEGSARVPVMIDVAGRGEEESEGTVAGTAGGSVSAFVIASVLS